MCEFTRRTFSYHLNGWVDDEGSEISDEMAVPGVLGSKADSPGLNADSRRVEAEDAALRRLIASTVIFGDKKPDFSQVTGKVEAIITRCKANRIVQPLRPRDLSRPLSLDLQRSLG